MEGQRLLHRREDVPPASGRGRPGDGGGRGGEERPASGQHWVTYRARTSECIMGLLWLVILHHFERIQESSHDEKMSVPHYDNIYILCI